MVNERFARKVKALLPNVGKMVKELVKLEEITSIELRNHNHLLITSKNWEKIEEKVISIISMTLIGRKHWGASGGKARIITTWVPSKK